MSNTSNRSEGSNSTVIIPITFRSLARQSLLSLAQNRILLLFICIYLFIIVLDTANGRLSFGIIPLGFTTVLFLAVTFIKFHQTRRNPFIRITLGKKSIHVNQGSDLAKISYKSIDRVHLSKRALYITVRRSTYIVPLDRESYEHLRSELVNIDLLSEKVSY